MKQKICSILLVMCMILPSFGGLSALYSNGNVEFIRYTATISGPYRIVIVPVGSTYTDQLALSYYC